MSSNDPETGQVYTIELRLPARQALILRRVPCPSRLRDESMYEKNARGLRATFAYLRQR